MRNQRRHRRSAFRAWHIPAAILAVLLIGGTLWLLPRRADEVVLVDGAHRWDQSAAPPQRSVVWRPAEPLAAKIADASPDDSLVRPQFAEGGIALYYTLQRPGGEADIYRSQFDGQRWLAGEPVAELNSPASDFGPVISPDGKTLYLYSDRPGGSGGFDLYVAERQASGWSRPRNLGPQINTPAHEYDPAVTPDGARLFFASNRTRQMDKLLADAARAGEAVSPWKATLRAEPGLAQFDLFVSQRDSKAQRWKLASKVDAVNTPAANEGEPYVSPDGAFLYFASDRANDQSASANYDLYRARLTDKGLAGVENLGTGVNTAANEHDPALSPEGFRLVFSSDRALAENKSSKPSAAPPREAELYALYTSQATETFDDAYWDTSHLAGVAGMWWWIVLALILLGLLAALVWYAREVSLRRAPVPVFFLVALVIHLLMLTGAFFIPIEGVTIAERVKKKIQLIVAASLPLDSTHQSHADGKQAYEKVADLQSLETTKISAVPRQITQAPNMPLPTSRPAPTIPQRLVPEQLRERTETQSPLVVQEVVDPLMDRRQKVVEQMMADSVVKVDTTPKAVEAESQAPPTERLSSARTDAPQRLEIEPTLPRRRPDLATLIEQEQMKVESVSEPEAPAQESPTVPVERTARADAAQMESPKVQINEIASTPADSEAGEEQLARLDVVVERSASAALPADLPRRASSARATSAETLLEPVDAGGAAQESPTIEPRMSASAAASEALERQDQLARIEAAESGSIEAIVPTNNSPSAPDGGALGTPSEKVNLPRSSSRPALAFGAPRSKADSASAAPSSLKAEVDDAEAAASAAPQGSTIDDLAAIVRRGTATSIAAAEGPATEPIELPSPTGGEAADADPSLTGESVQVARSGDPMKLTDIAKLSGTGKVNEQAPSRLAAAAGELRESSAESPAQSALAGVSAELPRSLARAALAEAADAGRIETGTPVPSPAGEAQLAAVDGVDVNMERATSSGALSVNVPTPAVLGGRYDDKRRDLAIGELAKAEVDADPSFSPIPSALDRERARAPFLLYAQDKIGLQAMLRLRIGDDTQKQDLIDAFGGRKDTLAAIQHGLHWLVLVQHADGHWDLKDFPKGPGGENFSGHGSEKSDTAATGLALLPFLGDGHTHEVGKYQTIVAKGIDWLVKNQKEDGDLFVGGEGNSHLYSHGIATIALCEAYGISKDEKLREPAQRAVEFIVQSQHDEGGWRYRPRERGDTSVVGWQIMALKSAQMAGLNVPGATLDKARDWLNKSRYGQDGRDFAYQPGGGGTPALTAEGLLCMEYLGSKRGDPQLMRTVDSILERVPKNGQDTSYYWYYGTQAIFHVQGEPWQKWNAAMSDAVLSSQVPDGPHRGTWDPRDEWETRGGRIYATSLRLLMLEVYFRHLPLYQALE